MGGNKCSLYRVQQHFRASHSWSALGVFMLFCHMLPEQCVRARGREAGLSHIFILAVGLMLLSSTNDVREEYTGRAGGAGFQRKTPIFLKEQCAR